MVATSPYGYAPAQRDPTAVVGRRIGAFFIDAVVALVVGVLLFFALADKVSVSEAQLKYDCRIERFDPFGNRDNTTLDCPGKLNFNVNDTVWVVDGGPYFVLYFLYSFAYYALLPGLTGWTLGKRFVGLRVVDSDGKPAAFWRHVVRWLLFVFVDALFLLLPGLITMLASKGHRRVGDMVAGTFVVAQDAVGTPPLANAAAPPVAYGTPPPWGTPAGAPSASWPAPTGPPASAAPGAPPRPAPQAMTAPPPQWDPNRGTYLQWDPATGTWLQWDDARRRWRPIDT